MGKKRNKRKKNAPKLRESSQLVKNRQPDDYFAAGPMEVARFGRAVIMRSRATREQFHEMQQKMAADLPGTIEKINALVTDIAHQVSQLPPDQLLQRAWWQFAATMMGLGEGSSSDAEQGIAMRMIDYVQSVIASVPPILPYKETVSEEEWAGLSTKVQELFRTVSFDYQLCLSAHGRERGSEFSDALEEFRFRAEVLWMNVRGERYQEHEIPALRDVLLPHSDILVRLFGITAEDLLSEFEKILWKLTAGLGETLEALARLQDEALERMQGLAEEADETATLEGLRDQVFADAKMNALRERVVGQFFGLDLFDVRLNTTLPDALIAELTYRPGEEAEFFAPGDFSGWPLRVWPTMKRPFIELSGRTLCFDLFALFDNCYRGLQRIIFRLAPEYKETWNVRQKDVSEELPLRYLTRLLPGATTYHPVYYRWGADGTAGQWHEADGILVYDDHLIVLEVKAGAFTHTSPATDLPAHISSLKGLVENPAKQGKRFVEYLESAPEVSIANADHTAIAKLRRADYRQVTVCAVTLDAFTELAARAQHLDSVGIHLSSASAWVVSVDDLRVYADLFTNPLEFLHYLEHRMKAAASPDVDLDDELDHLGLYLKTNDYARHAGELRESGRAVQFSGYRSPIDDFYKQRAHGQTPPPPGQPLPRRIREILDQLASSNKVGRSRIASFLLDASGEYRVTIARMIAEQLHANQELGRPRPFSTYGEHAFTLCVWSPTVPRNHELAVRHTQTVVAAEGTETGRLLLELEYGTHGQLLDVNWKIINLADLTGKELKAAQDEAQKLMSKRVANAMKEGKIGRNDPCPCGRGKKFKMCHGGS